MIEHIVPALMKTITERGTRPSVATFSLKTTTQDSGWGMEINAGIPETDACIIFKGGGQSVRAALAELAVNVIMERPDYPTKENSMG